ncbi:bromodomain adjacent to zinc finger domain protein 2B-like isoform X3 [Antedon mediterranea]
MEPVENSSSESPLGTRSVYESPHLLGHSGFPSTGTSQEPFSMSSVPSAFSVIGHGFPTGNRTPGSEFGGLGSLRNDSMPSPSSTSTTSHNTMSPSGGATWWTQPHGTVPGLGLSGSRLGLTGGGNNLGLTPSFSNLSKDSTVKDFESFLFTGKNQKNVNEYLGYESKTPASPPTAVKPSQSSTPTGEKRGRGRPRKSDSPRHADISIGNTHTDIVAKSADRAKFLAEKKAKNVPSPMEVTESDQSTAYKEAHSAFEASGSEHSLENKKETMTSSSDVDMEEDDDDDTTSDDLDGTNESENSEISSNSEEDDSEEEHEMETIMKTKKELELKQKELLEQEKKIKQQQQEARQRKKEKLLKDQHSKSHNVNDEREREEEQKKKAEQLTLQFEQQIKAQQQQLKIQKKMEAEKRKNRDAKQSKAENSKREKSMANKHSTDDTPLNLSKRSSTSSPSSFTFNKDNEDLAKFVSTHEKLIARTTKQAAERIKVALKAKMVKPGARQIADEMMIKATARLREHASIKKAAKAQNSSKRDSDSSDDDDDSLGDNSGDSGSDLDTEGDSDNDHLDTDALTIDSADDSSPLKYYKRNMPSTSMYYDPGPIPQKRLRVTDVEAVNQPLQYGFRRQTIIRQLGPEDQVKGEVIYYGPCGKKLRNYPEVLRYLKRRQITTVGREHFSFSAKVKVGEYLNPRPDGGMGIVFEKLTAEELTQRLYSPPPPRGRVGRTSQKAHEKRRIARELTRRSAEAKLKKKLEQEEMARRVQENKMKRKLDRHQRASVVREQRRLQALHMAEEKRRHKEMIRLHREQQKIMRMEQLRMEREMRAQQIFEDRRKRRQQIEAKKNRDALKKAKERELRRQQTVLLKHQKLTHLNHLTQQTQERERRKQHMLLVRALEARKKAEEKERVKEEKKNEKKVSRERKVQLKRMELHMMKELKKPVDDLKVIDPKLPLPELPRIPGVKLPGQAFADCIMIIEFMHNFGESLGLDLDDDVPSLNALQEGLLNNEDYNTDLLRFTVRLLRLAYDDPGLPDDPIMPKTAWGENILKVDINKKTMSEMLRLLLINVNGQENELSQALSFLPFKALVASQKAAILAFLVNQLVCSKLVVQQIDESIDDMSSLRKDKWVVEGKLRQLRSQQAKKNSKSAAKAVMDSFANQSGHNSLDTSKTKRDEDEEDDDDKDEEDDDAPPEGVDEATVEEEDDGMTSEELQKKIDRLEKQHGQFKCKVFNKSHSLRGICFGQDRYRRRYFVLPHAGGVFVEGMESSELPEALPETEVKNEPEKLDIKQEGNDDVNMEGIEEEAHKSINGEVKEETHIEMKVNIKEESKEEIKDKIIDETVHSESKNVKDDDKTMNLENGDINDVSKIEANDEKMEEESELKPNGESNIVQNGFADNCEAKLVDEPDKLLPKSAEQSKLNIINVPKMIEDTLRKELCENVESTDKDGKTIEPTKSKESKEKSVESGKKTPTKSANAEMNGSLLYGDLSQQDNPLLFPYPVVSGSPVFPTGLDAKLNGATSPWFSILPRIPCDEATLASMHVSDSSTSNTLKHSSLPMFNLPPYSIYQLPFPIMPMQPMNSFLNPYGFPGLSPMQMHPFMGLQGMSPTVMDAQAMAAGSSHRSTPFDDNASDDFASEDIAIANMQKLLDERENSPLIQVPDELRNGWFHISEPEMIQSVIKNLNQRGIRERNMQKNFQKMSEYAYKATTKTDKHIESLQNKEDNSVEMVGGAPAHDSKDNWSKKILFNVKRSLLQSIETLEEKIYSASMQVKGWTLPEKISNKKHISSLEQADENGSNLMEIASQRLLDVEKSIERRYIKPPLSRNHPVSLLCVKTSASQRTYDDEDDVCPALQKWRTAVGKCTAASQVHVCIRTLEKCVAWEKSIMKVFCQLCRDGENEALLLICDGCDKGFHTYCVVPKMESIPEGNWFCMECVSKATGKPGICNECEKTGKLVKCDKCPRSYHIDCLDPPLSKFPRGKWLCPPCIKAKDKAKSQKKKNKGKKEDGCSTPTPDTPEKTKADSKPKSEDKSDRRKSSKKLNPAMAPCKQLLTELEKHEKAEPFLYPVDLKRFPIYKKVIKTPMDLHTIRSKLKDNQYSCPEDFAIDVRTIFDNCETFNEDDSDVGFAGHQLRSYFEERWSDIERDL